MSFTSFNFVLFFPSIIVIYLVTPVKYRYLTLLISSYFFYLNIKPVYGLLLALVTLSTYIFTRLIGKSKIESRKKTLLIINIVLILSPLLFYKYFIVINNSIIDQLESLNIRWPLPEFKLILPIGISFYTFMAIGYTIDVFNDEIEPEKHLGIVSLYLSFFPLILSGPIERAKNMLPQLNDLKKVDKTTLKNGLQFILWGYFMKLVVADRLGFYVNDVFNNISKHNGTTLMIASLLYPIQIYGDLGGYSLISVGIARVLGINVMQNFKRPFFGTSMSEFWRRWHISLISWLKDYLFNPLSFTFRKFKQWGVVTALMITFLISGIWHGPKLTFIVWGFMQGVFLSIEALTNKKRSIFEKKYNLHQNQFYIFITCSITFILFSVSQIFGRALSLSDALAIFSKIFTSSGTIFIGTPSNLIFGLFGIFLLFLKDYKDEFMPQRFIFLGNEKTEIRLFSYYVLIMIILLLGVFDGGEFIYFQF